MRSEIITSMGGWFFSLVKIATISMFRCEQMCHAMMKLASWVEVILGKLFFMIVDVFHSNDVTGQGCYIITNNNNITVSWIPSVKATDLCQLAKYKFLQNKMAPWWIGVNLLSQELYINNGNEGMGPLKLFSLHIYLFPQFLSLWVTVWLHSMGTFYCAGSEIQCNFGT